MNTEKDKVEKIMENLDLPSVDVSKHQKEFRLTLLNSKKSAIAAALLLLLPFLFLSGLVLKHYMQVDFGIVTAVYDWIGTMDEKYGDHSVLNWLVRILLTVGPLAAIALNLFAVTHVRLEKASRELILSFKMKWLNWLIVLVSATIFSIFFLYLLVENG